MVSYTNDFVGIQSLEDRNHEMIRLAQEDCVDHGFQDIHQLTVPQPADPHRWRSCEYRLGEYLLLNLYFSMGEEALSNAIQELYWLSSYVFPGRDEQGIGIPTDVQVFETFLKHTPPGQEDAVREVYRRIHGGFTADPSYTI